MKVVSAIFSMSRPINCLITFITIVVACLICGNASYDFSNILIGGIIGMLITASGNIINDYYDIETDKINRPMRPLPMNLISPITAVTVYSNFNIIAFVLSTMLGWDLFLITVITALLLLLYSYKLKRVPLAGNFIIAFLTGLAFIFGSVIVGNFYCGIFPAVFAFVINFMREIVKDIEDVEGDRAVGLTTYPIKFGIVSSVNIISFAGIILIVLTAFPFFLNIYDIKYFLTVIMFVDSIIVFVISRLRKNPSNHNLMISSSLLKVGMVLGIIAIVLGSKF